VLVTVPRMEIADYLSSLVQLTQEGRLRPAAEYHCSPTSFGYTCNFGGQRIPLGAPGRCYVHHFTKLRTGPATLHEGGHLGFVLPAGRAPNSRLGGFGTTYPKDALGGNDPVGLARLLVTTEIARNLGQGVRPAIVPRPRTDWGDLRFAPRSLIEALWLQFAEAVCHDKDYRPCEVCGKPFEISPAVARTNRRLCSAGCKAKAYRLRKARVCRLWDRGITLTTIVRDSGSDEEQVQKWLAIHLRGKEQSLRSIAEQLGVTVYQVKKWTQKEGGK